MRSSSTIRPGLWALLLVGCAGAAPPPVVTPPPPAPPTQPELPPKQSPPDSAQARDIMELFQALNNEGATIVQVTHSDENASFGTRTVQMFDGAFRP